MIRRHINVSTRQKVLVFQRLRRWIVYSVMAPAWAEIADGSLSSRSMFSQNTTVVWTGGWGREVTRLVYKNLRDPVLCLKQLTNPSNHRLAERNLFNLFELSRSPSACRSAVRDNLGRFSGL